MMNLDPPTLAYYTICLISSQQSLREITKEETLLKDQACRTLKESLRYHEEQYSKAMEQRGVE